jgi:signal transduction histidine kinase
MALFMHVFKSLTNRHCQRFIIFLLITFLLPAAEAFAQDTVNIGKLRFSADVYKALRYEVVAANAPSTSIISTDITKKLPEAWRAHRVPADIIEHDLLVKFSLSNTSDSVQQVYFYPGAYFEKIELYRVSASNTSIIPADATEEKYRSGFRLVQLEAKTQSDFVARLRFVRTSATMFYPAVLQKEYAKPFLTEKKEGRSKTNMITYLASGIMLMMIFYSLAVFYQTGNKEFLYYSGYATCLALLLFLKSFLLYDFTTFNFFFESYWDFLVQCFGVACYFFFIRMFLDTKRKHPFLEKTFKIAQVILGICIAVYTILYFFSSDFTWLNNFENFTKQSLLVIGLIFIIYGARRKKDKPLRYMMWGNVFLLFFSLISFLLIVTPLKVTTNPNFSVLNSAIVYYEIGLVFELAWLLMGLAYKNRKETIERARERERLRTENEKKELEKQMAIMEAQQQERNRISADMHDELGSGVTAIRLMSEIVRAKMKDTTLPEIDKISNSANDLITKMNTIIWTMSSSNDTVENLITYIRTYAFEYFDSTGIECRFNLPPAIPNIELSGEKRRNIFLAVKESLNNVVKHARATSVIIDVKIHDRRLNINIQDNGVGIDFETIRRFGNGLKNIKSRLERINGKFTIVNNEGALTQFEMNL